MSAIAERVAAGAAFLDEHDPDWWRADAERAIDLDELDLADPGICILGQRCPLETLARHLGTWATCVFPSDSVFSFWARAYELSGLDPDSDEAIVAWSAGLGFNSLGFDAGEFCDLTAEWRRVIEARRSA